MTATPPSRNTAENPVLEAALACAARGWPVLPCQPGAKAPATGHGCRDATTDPGQITSWFARRPDRNLGIATGAPGPDVLDIDVRPGGSGYPALGRLARAGLTAGAAAWIRTPGGGLHGYFTGTAQRCGHLPGCHVDFRSAGGYALVPPSAVSGRGYQVVAVTAGNASLDWAAVTALLTSRAGHAAPAVRAPGGTHADVERLAAWVARLGEGNRNAGLFWAANRVLDAGHGAAALTLLADAALHAGLADREIAATLRSASRTARRSGIGWDAQAEAAS